MPINLISDNQKSVLRLSLISRKVNLGLALLSLSLLFFVLILFLLRVYVSSQVVQLSEEIVAQNARLTSAQFKAIKAEVAQTNQDLQALQKVEAGKVLLSPFLEKLSLLTPHSIYFTEINLRKNAREVENENQEKETQFFAEVLSQGIAQTREQLYDFRKTILEENWLEGPYFAPASWKNPLNSEFSLEALFVPKK